MFGSGEKSHGCFHPTLTQGIQQGIQQGAQQKTVENARKLLADGKYTAEKISELFKIPVEDFTDIEKA